MIKASITGFVVFEGDNIYTDEVDINIISDTFYTWIPNQEGPLISLGISGYLEGDSAEVYLGDKLIYSSGKLNRTSVTVSNGSGEILLEFNYGDNEGYDNNNDGVSYIENVIDYEVKGIFDFDVNYSKLCTKYVVNNLDDNLSQPVCYGDSECCSFLNLESKNDLWNDSLYLNYGKYSAGYNNSVLAQIIYYDVSLNESDLHSYIYNSELKKLDANFVDRIYFNIECVDTCSLPSYSDEFYDLEVKVDGLVHISNVSYSLEKVEKVDITTTVSTKQYDAVLGKPVKWQKNIKVNIKKNKVLNNLTIDVPSIAENISVNKIDAKKGTQREVSVKEDKKLEKLIKKDKKLIIEEEIKNEDEVIVEYYTTAPYSEEQIIDDKSKEIIIIGPEEVHYENVSVSTNLLIEVSDISNVKLYWIINESKELVSFESYDLDGNGLYDNIGWVVPHLSNQTYELIIEITKAEHLDENKTFISDIYEEVKELDDVWSETIPSEDYVRVTFEKELDSSRDITIYPRIVSGTPRIEVYEVDGTELIAEFTNINSEEYNKVYLTNLQGNQDTFDLLILDGSIEIDHIIDPTEIFYEDFESGGFATNWTQDAQADWFEEAVISQCGASKSAGVQFSTDAWLQTKNNFSLDSYDDAELSAALYIDGSFIAGEYLCMDYSCNGGVSWNRNATQTDGGVGGLCQDATFDPLDSWRNVTLNITSACGVLPSNFKVRFRHFAGNKDYGYVDCVNISATEGIQDNNYPIFSNYNESPVNNTAYVQGADYKFNVTITSTNGTAGLDFNGTNYTATNISSVFNVTINDLAAGDYSYYWWSYGNGTSNNPNSSETRGYTVAKATGQVTLYVNNSESNVTIFVGDSIWLNATLTTGDTGNLYLYNNGTLINNGTSPISNDTQFNSPGLYNISAYYVGSQNYTSDWSLTWWVNVTDNTPPYFTDNTPQNQTITYNTALSYDINATDGVAFDCFAVNDSKFKINCSGFLENNTFLLVNIYYLNITINDTSNNLNSTIMFVNVTQATPTLTKYLNGTDGNLSITYPTQVNASASTTGGTVNIYRNGTEVTGQNNQNVLLAAGYYEYEFNVTGNQNYTDLSSVFLYANISKAAGEVFMYINGSRANFTTTNASSKNIWLNATLNSGTGDIELWLNGTLYNSGPSHLSNKTNLSIGFYNATSVYSGNTNYSSDTEVWWINVTVAVADSPPDVSIIYPQNINYNINVSDLNYTASDDINVSACWYNNGTINSTPDPTCSNFTGLNSNEGNNTWTVYVNDTEGQENSDSVTFFKDTIYPLIEFVFPTTAEGNYSQNYITANVTATDDNLDTITVYLYNSTTLVNSSENSTSPLFINFTNLNDGTYYLNATVNDTTNNENQTEKRTIILDATPVIISNFQFIALNSSKAQIGTDETAFNFSNLKDIEYMNISFTLTDGSGIEGDIKIYFTANGTSACSLGNNQSTTCYNFDSGSWIEFQNNTDTSTFRDIGGSAQGDSINCLYTGSSTQRNYTCQIDEHYNPNVWKHYPLNFSDAKWQSLSSERINKGNIWKIELDTSNIPLDADFCKLDFRVNATVGTTPTQQILAYMCNSTYTTGDPSVSSYCQLVAGKSPTDLQDDGTKFRGLFAKNLASSLGDIKYVLITSDSPTSKYYSMKTYGFLGSDSVRTSISNNGGSSYTPLSDGYETELNINWFYDSTDSNLTQMVFKIYSNDTYGNDANSSEQIMTWNVGELNQPPIVDTIVPEIGSNHLGTIEINWTTAEPNGDSYLTNVTANNGTTIENIALNLADSISNTTWDTTTVSDGLWNLTVESCENSTSDLFCGNDTHQIRIDNNPPDVSIIYPESKSYAGDVTDLNYTASDDGILDSCWYNNGTINSTPDPTCSNFTGLNSNEGSNTWTVYANDSTGQEGSVSVTFIKDTTNPLVTGLTENPLDSPTYVQGATYEFNATVIDNIDVDTVLLDFNGTNYNATNITENIYNVTIIDLAVGTYNYEWYANDTVGNINNTETGTYTVNKAIPTGTLTSSGGWTIDYGTQTTINYSESNNGDSGVVYNIYRDGVDKTGGETVTLAAGNYSYVLNTTGGTNYTSNSSMDNKTLIVSQIASQTNLTFDLATPQTYGTSITPICSVITGVGTSVLKVNGTTITSGNPITLGSGTWSFNCSLAETQNYTYSQNTSDFTIDQATPPLNLTITPSASVNYPTQTTANGSGCPSQLTCNLYRNDTGSVDEPNVVTLGAGSYNYTYNTSGNANYTSYSVSDILIVNQAIPTGNLTSSAGWTIEEGTQTTINYSESNNGDSDVVYKIYRDNTDIGSNETWTPSLGTYSYVLNTTGGTNYTSNSSMDAKTLTVQDNTYPLISIVYPSNNSYSSDTELYINYSFTETNPGFCWWTNNSGVNNYSLATCGTNITTETWSEGAHTIIIYINDTSGNENSSSVTFTIDTFNPLLTIVEPQSITYTTSSLTINYSVSDDNLDSCWYTDDNGETNNTLTNCQNTTYTPPQGTTTLKIYANDSAGNINDTENVTFFVDSIVQIEFGAGTKPNASFANQEFIYVNVTVIEDNFSNITYELYNSTNLLNSTIYYTLITTINWTNLSNDNVEYFYNVSAFDDFGNFNSTGTRKLTLTQNNPPQVSIIYPESKSYAGDVTDLNYTASDDGILDSCWYNNGTINSTPDPTCSNFTGLNSNEGSNTWTVYANDSTGQEGSASVTFIKDTTYPTFSSYLRSPDPPNEDEDIQVNVTVTEENNDTVLLEWNGTVNYTITTNNGDEYYFTIAQGNYTAHDIITYYWYANDTAGNLNKSIQQSFKVENRIPSVSQPSLNDTTPQTNDVISCDNGTFSDDDAEDGSEEGREFKWYNNDSEVSEETSQTLDLSVSNLDKGNVIKCSIRVNDSYNWSSWVNSSNTATINNTAPVITTPQPPVNKDADGTSYDYDYNVTDPDAGDTITWYDNTTLFNISSSTGVISHTPSEGEAGSYSILINVSDGTVQDTDSFTYTINDVTYPLIEWVNPTKNSGVLVHKDYIEINVTVIETNLDTITIRLYNSTNDSIKTNTSNSSPFYIKYSSLNGGLYFYNATVNDTVDNKNSTETRNITLDTNPPTLTINKPKNETYFENVSLKLNISTNADNTWYNIDDENNITLEQETYFNTSDGTHTIYVFANNSFGITTKNVTFDVDLNLYNINNSKFKGSEKGNSTNFNEYSFEEIQNLSNIILENTSSGKIQFNDVINLTDDANSSDNETDLENNIYISFNRIEVNSNVLPNFNKNATLALYNLNFNNPRILKDGSICPSEICKQNSYSVGTGTLSFNVTSFTVYSSEETPEGGALPSKGGGGGTLKVINFSIDNEVVSLGIDTYLLNLKLKQGETRREKIVVENKGNRDQKFNLKIKDIERFVILNEKTFTLSPENSKEIYVDFYVSENEQAELHTGKIIVSSGQVTKSINVILDIIEKIAIFDIRSELTDVTLAKNQKISSKIDMKNIGDLRKRVDVVLEYFIKDFEGNQIKLEEETIGVDGNLIIERKFTIPEKLEHGDYLFYVKLNYLDSIATSANPFTIVKEPAFITYIKAHFIVLLINLLFIIGITFIELRRMYKLPNYQFYFLRLFRFFKEKNKIVQISLIVLLVICGIAFNPYINQGLFKEKPIQPIVKIEKLQVEQFSPEPLLNVLPFIIALLIIITVVWIKEDERYLRKTLKGFAVIIRKYFIRIKVFLLKPLKHVEKKVDNVVDVGKTKAVSLVKEDERYLKRILKGFAVIIRKYFNKIKRFLLKLFKKTKNKIDNIKNIDLGGITNKLFKIKQYKDKLKKIYGLSLAQLKSFKLKEEYVVKQRMEPSLDRSKFIKKGDIMFIFSILIMLMCGIAFNSEINHGLFKESYIQPIVKTESIHIEQFSPVQLLDWGPIVLALIVIILIVLIKEDKINIKKIQRISKNLRKIIKRNFRKIKWFLTKKVPRRINNIKGIDVAKIIRRLKKVKPHKKLKKHYITNIHPKVSRELIKTNELFVKEYKKEYTDKFIALLFIMIVVGMSIFAFTPKFNPGVIVEEQPLVDIMIIKQPVEYFSPEPMLNIWPFILALLIIIIVSIIKFKREKED
ncbi:hypothetical protein CEE44_01815 [Candidatus Woesearchaeota archaeon B3_Woes]|nr:MAG: hypothetical protein CEE44_01815 [Candidatus Woesearchaeota archaeon B3_Woes]